jgi:hypothetical protein
MGISLSHDTAPSDALRLGYEFGKKLRSWGFVPEQFPAARRAWVDRAYSSHNLVSHVRVGFTAGFWGKPVPQVDLEPLQSLANAS